MSYKEYVAWCVLGICDVDEEKTKFEILVSGEKKSAMADEGRICVYTLK